jgi:hypothetical protein
VYAERTLSIETVTSNSPTEPPSLASDHIKMFADTSRTGEFDLVSAIEQLSNNARPHDQQLAESLQSLFTTDPTKSPALKAILEQAVYACIQNISSHVPKVMELLDDAPTYHEPNLSTIASIVTSEHAG